MGLQSLIVLFYTWQHFANWPLLQMSRIRGQFNFQDFVTIFTSTECFREIGLQIYVPDASSPLCFYPYGRTLIYLIDLFRIPPALAPAIVVLISLMILNIALLFLRNAGRDEKIFIFLVFVSPPLWLAFERGNADLLICLLVLVSAYAAYKGKTFLEISILVLATLIKFYTLPLLILILWRRRKNINPFASLILVSIISYIILTDILMQNLQQPGSFAFGSPVVTFWINAISSHLNLPLDAISIRNGQVIGLFFLALIAALFFKMFTFPPQLRNLNSFSLSGHCFFHLGVVYVTCFALGMSYDYRLIFSALASIFFLRSLENFGNRRLKFATVWLLSLWLSVFSFGFSPKIHLLIQWCGNVFDFITAGLILSLIVKELSIRQLRDRIL